MQTELLAPITKSSAPCLLQYSKVINVDNVVDIQEKLNLTIDTTLPSSR